MTRWVNWALKIMLAGVVTSVLLGVAAPRALGFCSPSQLWATTRPRVTLQAEDLAPGDAVTQTVEIRNGGTQARFYRIVFVKWGRIWSCDAGGHSLDYDLTWSADADYLLQPGEIEKVYIRIGLPLSAQSGCMGQRGYLYIRRGAVEKERDGGVYECITLPFFKQDLTRSPDPTGTRGIICYKSGVPLDHIINPHRWRRH